MLQPRRRVERYDPPLLVGQRLQRLVECDALITVGNVEIIDCCVFSFERLLLAALTQLEMKDLVLAAKGRKFSLK